MAQTLREIYNQAPEKGRNSYFMEMMKSVREIYSGLDAPAEAFADLIADAHEAKSKEYFPNDNEVFKALDEAWIAWAVAAIDDDSLWQEVEREVDEIERACVGAVIAWSRVQGMQHEPFFDEDH